MLNYSKVLDLSQDFSIHSPAFAGYMGPQLRWIKRLAFDRGGGQELLTTMHVSTHLDAPAHFQSSGKFIGDMPHTWVGSDFIRSMLDMFAYEREGDSSLVIGAGIPEKWVRESSGTGIRGLSTHYGKLNYTAKSAGAGIEVRIDAGVRVPRGGLVVRSPADKPPRSATINGRTAQITSGEVVVRALPAVIRFDY